MSFQPLIRFRLNRTFYGIETGLQARRDGRMTSLNRTFYGIETGAVGLKWLIFFVLIVPFMELKLR